MLLVLGWIVIRIIFKPDITEPETAQAQAEGESPSAQPAQREELSEKDLDEIIKHDIFDSADTRPPKKTGSRTGVETTEEITEPAEQHLELQGTVAGPSEVAMAIIKDRQKKLTDVYKIGDALGAARIVSIRKDAVILQENGQKKILKLETSRSPSTTVKAVPSVRTGTKESASRQTPTPPPHARRIQILEDILDQAVIEPAVQKNQTVGLQISKLDEIPLAKLLGIQNGDIIQRVNGQLLTSKQKAFQVFRKAKTQPEIVLELIRNGKREALSFSLR